MKHVMSALVAAALLVAPRAAAAQTVDELIAKNLEARGGLEKLKAVQTLKMTARLSSQGMDMGMTMYGKRPGLSRKEMTMGAEKMIFVFDGTAAWNLNTLQGANEPVAITGPELDLIKRESDFDSPFVDYKARGYAIELVGTESVAGRSLHHLRVTRNNTSLDCYLDAVSGLETKTVSASPMGPIEQEFLDYRDVQGIKMPFTVRTVQNGRRVSEIRIDAIQFNGTLDDTLFKKPAR